MVAKSDKKTSPYLPLPMLAKFNSLNERTIHWGPFLTSRERGEDKEVGGKTELERGQQLKTSSPLASKSESLC
jgi:hypothetical protein